METMRRWQSGRRRPAAARRGAPGSPRGRCAAARVRASSRRSPAVRATPGGGRAAGAPRRVFRCAPRADRQQPHSHTRSPARLQSERRRAARGQSHGEAAGRLGQRLRGRTRQGARAGCGTSESFRNQGAEEGTGTPRAVRGSVPGKPRRWSRAAPAARGVEKENRKRGGRAPGRG